MATYVSNYLGDFHSNYSQIDEKIHSLELIDSIDYGPVSNRTDTMITGHVNGGRYYFYGSGFSSNTQATITKIKVVLNEYGSFVLDGNVVYNINTDVLTGYISHLKLTLLSGLQLDIFGKQTTDQKDFIATKLVAQDESGTLIFKGKFKFGDQTSGLINEISYLNSDGRYSILKGLKVNASLIDLDSIDELIPQFMSGNDNAKGNASENVLYGYAGNDTLDGGKGLDTLIGGLGDDTYVINLNDPDVVTEQLGEGNDTCQIISNNKSKIAAVIVDMSDYLNLENITISGKGLFNLIGDTNANRLIGNVSANSISGGDGDDTLIGGRGTDPFTLR